jgi:hypothetical protein
MRGMIQISYRMAELDQYAYTVKRIPLIDNGIYQPW